ncbi:polysaccharide deacetylase family protein [Undibacterium sp. TJN19]|uniref:polysaccharide deacetylase family protein n=1 Tax=Undibacterium sp. TJN19 TaxID=3413055 RepID=UPI003BF1B1F8
MNKKNLRRADTICLSGKTRIPTLFSFHNKHSPSSCLLFLLIAGLCNVSSATNTCEANPAPIRFVLTFDDGPSAVQPNNPTEKVLSTLLKNRFQQDIKAIFFTQTRAVNGGGTEFGRSMLKREVEAGHVLAFHTATPRHSNHRYLKEGQLDTSLDLGIADLTGMTGIAPKLVRPPFWNYDARTLDSYHGHGLQMLLTDLSANDGIIYGINFSLTKRRNMRKMLLTVRPQWCRNEMPSVDGATPIIVTFHDINSYTANHMDEYLEILLDVAKELEIPTSEKPFYDDREELERAALVRVIKDAGNPPELPGMWNWFWRLFS